MPKMKPHKGMKKRLKVTATGKVMRKMSFAGHLMSSKPGRRCQRLRKIVPLPPAWNAKALRAMCEE